MTLHIGRVMTPTLALAVTRENDIAGFQKEKFYTVVLNLPNFQASSGKFSSRQEAEKLRSACTGVSAVVEKMEQEEKKEPPPKLYDLTTLQREANCMVDFTAQKTLDLLQALYEKRLVTYPRTDSRYLTEDMVAMLPKLCGKAVAILPFMADVSLSVNAAAVIDDSRVTDRHALIPTLEIAKADLSSLTADERTILHMIAVRLVCAVGEPYCYNETAVTVTCGGGTFSAKGRTVTAEGWKGIEKAFRATL